MTTVKAKPDIGEESTNDDVWFQVIHAKTAVGSLFHILLFGNSIIILNMHLKFKFSELETED